MKIYGAYDRDNESRSKSSSGGIFPLLSKYVLDKDGVVFGVRFDDEFNVIHDYFDNIHELDKFRGSKYVQSKLGNTFLKVKEFLEQNRYVLFTGTPCQIVGLRNFLNKDYDKLITCDLICHGTPKVEVWKDYIKYIEQKYDSKIKYINFKEKNSSWRKFNMLIELNNGIIHKKGTLVDKFLWMFLNDYILTSNCYKCRYTNTNRMGDFTIGDFWGVDKRRPSLYDDKGTSLIFVNSDKAEKIFDNIKEKLIYEEISVEESVQRMLRESASKPENYDDFWIEYNTNGMIAALKKVGFNET